MSRLALVWDGAWLTWTTFTNGDVGRREILRPDMVPEVLRALRNQVGAGAQVVHAEWGQPATAMPQALISDAHRDEELRLWHQLHHGPLPKHHGLNVSELAELGDAPWLAVGASSTWLDAVESQFPQARHVPLAQALIHDAVTWNRSEPHEGWTFRAHMREDGGVLVAVQGEALQWVHHVSKGINAEDVLYAMVNAAHRSGADVHQARVKWSGSPELAKGWERFLSVHAVEAPLSKDKSATWTSVFHSMVACG